MHRITALASHVVGPQETGLKPSPTAGRAGAPLEGPLPTLLHPAGAKAQPAYDIIVVGAGSAGCAAAARLAEQNPLHTVLLVEAGGSNQLLKVRLPFLTCPRMQNSEFDWCAFAQLVRA